MSRESGRVRPRACFTTPSWIRRVRRAQRAGVVYTSSQILCRKDNTTPAPPETGGGWFLPAFPQNLFLRKSCFNSSALHAIENLSHNLERDLPTFMPALRACVA